MNDKEIYAIKKMIDCIDKVKKYTDGYTLEAFIQNEEKIDATVFVIS